MHASRLVCLLLLIVALPAAHAFAIVAPPSVSVLAGSMLSTAVNITPEENLSGGILTVYYNGSLLLFNASAPGPSSLGPGELNISLPPIVAHNQTSIPIFFTTSIAGTTNLTYLLRNSSLDMLNGTATFVAIASGGGGGGGGGGGANYSPVWVAAQPASLFPGRMEDFAFAGAPYVARGSGCGLSFTGYGNATPGDNCCSQKSMNGTGCVGSPFDTKVPYDTDAVWVDQHGEFVSWHVTGAFHKSANLSSCDAVPRSAAFVVEFDIDDNRTNGTVGTGCLNNESCYPGSDYQLWFFPDTNKTLFTYYNGSNNNTRGAQPGSPAGGIAFVPDAARSSDSMWVYYNCSATAGGLAQAQYGLTIIANKSAFNVSTIKLKFELNTFNTTEATTNPIDLLSDYSSGGPVQRFLVTGPAPDVGGCAQYDKTNQSACVNNTAGQRCVWETIGQLGICKPDFHNFQPGEACFTLSQSSCSDNANNGIGYCEWQPYISLPNGSTGLCGEQFKPFEFSSGDCDSSCSNCFAKAQCEASDANGGAEFGGCSWYNDTINPYGFCADRGLAFGCAANPADCTGSVACAGAGWHWNGSYAVCIQSSVSEICFNNVDDNLDGDVDCADATCESARRCGGGINTITGDYAGYTPQDALAARLGEGMQNILLLSEDILGDTTAPHFDAQGFAIGIGTQGLGLGLGVQNLSTLIACGGANDVSFFYAIDTDANVSTGCPFTVDATTYTGYEFAIRNENYTVVNQTSQFKQLYACVDAAWVPRDAPIASPVTEGPGGSSVTECRGSREMNGAFPGVVMIEKTAIGNPRADMRFFAAIVNGTGSNVSNMSAFDTISNAYYTPGTIDFTPIDCFSEPTKCGSEFMILGGGQFMPLEECLSPQDDDADGQTNCADSDCSRAPQCAGIGYNSSQDTSAPKVKLLTVEPFTTFAKVRWVTNEPTNGSVRFYATDDSCASENLEATVIDLGDPATTIDDMKPWHDTILNAGSLGSPLTPSTQYYFKTISIDQAGNTGISACLDFTTTAIDENVSMAFSFSANSSNVSDVFGNLAVLVNGVPVSLDAASSFNASNGQDVNITFTNPNASAGNNWSITIVGADLMSALAINLSDAFVNGSSGNNTTIGMANSEWLTLVQELGASSVVLQLPDPGRTLMHCNDNATSCYNVTNFTGVARIGNTSNTSTWEVPTTLGFSTYDATSIATASVDESSGDSGGGGGGGGGGGSGGGGSSASTAAATAALLNSTQQQFPLAILATGNRYSLVITRPAIPFTNITFLVTKQAAYPTVRVSSGFAPLVVPVGDVYEYVIVDHEGLQVGETDITFRVPQAWLAQHGNPTITLQRQQNATWETIPARRMSSTEEYVTYWALSPGLSFFAIVGTGGTPVAAPAPPPVPVPPAASPTTGNAVADSVPAPEVTPPRADAPSTLVAATNADAPSTLSRVVRSPWLLIGIVAAFVLGVTLVFRSRRARKGFTDEEILEAEKQVLAELERKNGKLPPPAQPPK